MKQCLCRYGLTILFIQCVLFAIAQNDSTQGVAKEKPAFKLGVYYNTHLNYFGRTDSLKSSAVFPLAELWFTRTFYINAAPIFVNNSVQHFEYAGAVATIGHRYTAASKKLATHVYIVKPFYPDNSQLPQSALRAQGAFTFSFLNKIINLTAGADVKFSKGADLGATGGVDHVFRYQLDAKTLLILDPSAYVNAGTQKFTGSYYQSTGIPGLNQQVTKNTTRFAVLSYEFSMPMVLSRGQLVLLAIPAYVLPQHLIQMEGRPDLSERGESLFYTTLGIKYNF